MNSSEVERATLMQTSRDWARVSATRDEDQIVSFWTEDAIVMPPDHVAVVGKIAIRDFIHKSLEMPGFSITWEPEQAVVAVEGSLGYLVESNRTTFQDASGTLQTQSGKVVTIWKKDASGHWRCAIDIWNGNPLEEVRASEEST